VNDVGEPCAGEPHARFDGRALETARRPKAAALNCRETSEGDFGPVGRLTATAPAPYPTILFAEVTVWFDGVPDKWDNTRSGQRPDGHVTWRG
jgi:hypothetical protein